jgi:hypothetical protein
MRNIFHLRRKPLVKRILRIKRVRRHHGCVYVFWHGGQSAMEGELWNELYPVICMMGKRFRSRCVQISNTMVILVYAWSVLHDRPVSWACRAENWPAHLRPPQLPSPATMSRRMRRVPVLQCLQAIEFALRDQRPRTMLKKVDAKPLPVGSYSKDHDARWGRAGAAQARGYKLFALCDGEGVIDNWRIGPMNQSESTTALRLVESLEGGGYLLGDALYDTNDLYGAVAQRGWQLLAPRKKPGTGLGHRLHHPARRRSIEMLETAFGRGLYGCRTSIERYFGNIGSFGGGLGPLPSWVRRPHRVATWVQVKIIINAVRTKIKCKCTA